MRFSVIFFNSLLFVPFLVQAQVDYYIEEDTALFDTIAVLIDDNYSIEDILNNPDLEFTKKTTISVKGVTHYWVKCNVTTGFAYDRRFSIWTHPMFNSELFYFNHENEKWQSEKGGFMKDKASKNMYLPCVFKAEEPTTIYIKVDVSEINHSVNELRAGIYFQSENITESEQKEEYTWWLITVAIIFAFLVYNLYWYLLIREKVYIYYLIILIGGLIYITSYSYSMHLFIRPTNVNAAISPENNLYYTSPNFVYSIFGALIVISGFVQFTREYLKLYKNFPKWDTFLKYILFFFIISQGLFISAEHFKWVSPGEVEITRVNNLIYFLILILILVISFKSYAKKVQESLYFLKALFIPIIFMLGLIVYLFFIGNMEGLKILSNLACLSITITFAVALVARVNLIKDELSAAKYEKQTIMALNELEKERNLRLEEKIEYNKNEVAAAQQIKLLMKELHHRVKNNLQIVSSLLSLQSFRVKDQEAKDAIQEGQHRIEAMSLIHQKLYIQDAITQVNIKEFITDIAESLMHAYGFDRNNFELQIHIDEELLDVDKAIPVSIIINELITNAFKYAYKTVKHPKLIISFTKQSTQASLSVIDNGVGIDLKNWNENEGYGKELIQTFTEQLEGTLQLKVSNGTTFKIVFPY